MNEDFNQQIDKSTLQSYFIQDIFFNYEILALRKLKIFYPVKLSGTRFKKFQKNN